MTAINSLGQLRADADQSAESTPGVALGLDIGGTKMSAGIVSASGEVYCYERRLMPATVDESSTLTIVDELVDRLLQDHPAVTAIGIGCAGMVEWPSGVIRFAANSSYRDFLLREHVAQRTGIRTMIDNDGNAAAWAEYRTGAATGHRDMVMLTVGTGIGCGACLDGRIFRGSAGLSLEVGHLTVDPKGPTCGCGNRGCLEARVSGTVLARLGKEAAAIPEGAALAALADGAEHVTGEVVHAAARAGDATALALYDEMGFWLGIGIACVVTLLDPTIVVLGGGMMAAGDLLLRPAQESFSDYVYARSSRQLPPLCLAQAGPRAGVVGAALMALDDESLPVLR